MIKMLIDIVKSYDDEKKKFLLWIWEETLVNLATQCDVKKIFSFLKKVWIIDISESEKMVYVWVPNEFIMAQVKKYLGKQIKTSIKNVYNEQFDVKFVIYEPFNNWWDLTADLEKLLKIKEKNIQNEIKSTPKKVWNGLWQEFGILFDPSFTFDNFIAWSSNSFAYNAAKAVADAPGIEYNPLFLYGGVWLGKTHLMQAIWNQIISNDHEKVVTYLPTSKLIDEIVSATRKNNLQWFLSKFNGIDVLMIDDIQFIAGKDKTQEIFHNIFNDFQSKKKQIVISGDRPPIELTSLEPRLRSRFSLWLIVDIKSPDFETRIAILQSDLEAKWEYLDYDVLELIAKNVTNNVRELKWILLSLLSMKKLCWSDLNCEFVSKYLRDAWYIAGIEGVWPQNIPQNIRWEKNFSSIVEYVCNYYDIPVSEIKSDSRKKDIAIARQLLMLIARENFDWTLKRIWDFFGGKDHASVIYATDTIKKKLKIDKNIAHDYTIFLERLNS